MKRTLFATCLCLIFILSTVSLLFVGCTHNSRTDITTDEITQAYADSKYYARWYACQFPNHVYSSYFQVSQEANSDQCVYIWVFANADEAETFIKEHKWTFGDWMLSVIAGEPTWIYNDQYGNVVVQYERSTKYLLRPFFAIV